MYECMYVSIQKNVVSHIVSRGRDPQKLTQHTFDLVLLFASMAVDPSVCCVV